MKKSLLVVAIAMAATTAFATDVTIYGIIDTGPVIQKQKGKAANVNMASAFDLGSRWGIRGNEDLGGGTSVGFDLENGFDPSTGSTSIGGSGAMFGREASIWLRNTTFGRLGFGRAATLWSGLGTWDMQTGYVFMGGYGLIGWPIAQDVGGNFNRVNNMVAYQSEYFSGARIGLMYSNGGSVSCSADDTAKWSENSHYYGAVLQYNSGALKTALGFEASDNKGDTSAERKFILNYGLEYNLGWATPMFAYRWLSQNGGYKLHTFALSGRIPAWGGNFKAAVRYSFGKTEDPSVITDTDKIQQIALGVAYEYPLSKRTVLKPFIGYVWSGKAWHDHLPLESDVNAIYNGYQIYLGMHHFF